MDLGQSHIIIGLITIFIAFFVLFYIFDSIDKIVKKCQVGSESEICKEIGPNKFGLLVFVILLILGGLTLIICATTYILLTA
jgi:hypothetical protein